MDKYDFRHDLSGFSYSNLFQQSTTTDYDDKEKMDISDNGYCPDVNPMVS
ncbi:hypothetical protein BC751_2691 [Cecembia calidifontis]|uniref:Uncharacterized protein n=1 Tax=Cecembia calidifontis TaxID=1187080 RepID=A0A4Q7PA62_9BACT|nr:hypothetical protein BC751_2691 [Cecembia calidifontis]